MKYESRISIVSAFFVLSGTLLVDFVLDFIPVVSTIASICAFFLLWFYFKYVGVEQMGNIVGNSIDLIPVIEYLPAMTVGVVATILADWSPSFRKVATKAEKMTGANKLKVLKGGRAPGKIRRAA